MWKNYAKILTLLKMYTWNVPPGPPFRILNTPLWSVMCPDGRRVCKVVFQIIYKEKQWQAGRRLDLHA